MALVGGCAMREDGPSRGSVMIKTIRRYREVPSDPMQRQGTEPAPWLTPLSFQYPRADAETPPLRLLSQVTSKGQLVETDRSGLVGEYVGYTAVKTKAVIDEALGGVLFIDEAYTLAGKGSQDFGTEAIETLLKMMEDHRDDLVVIAAGYEREMRDFIGANPGLESRFQNFIPFEDYRADELLAIFEGSAQGTGLYWTLAPQRLCARCLRIWSPTRPSGLPTAARRAKSLTGSSRRRRTAWWQSSRALRMRKPPCLPRYARQT